MDINVRAVQGVTVVELAGELTGKTAPEAQRRILEQQGQTSRSKGDCLRELGFENRYRGGFEPADEGELGDVTGLLDARVETALGRSEAHPDV